MGASMCDKGVEASVNCMFRGRSAHALCGIYSGPEPCQAEAGTEIGARH